MWLAEGDIQAGIRAGLHYGRSTLSPVFTIEFEKELGQIALARIFLRSERPPEAPRGCRSWKKRHGRPEGWAKSSKFCCWRR